MKVHFTTIKDKTADKIPYNSFYPSRLFVVTNIFRARLCFFYNPQIPNRTERFSVTHKAKQGMLRWKLLKGVCTKNGHSRPYENMRPSLNSCIWTVKSRPRVWPRGGQYWRPTNSQSYTCQRGMIYNFKLTRFWQWKSLFTSCEEFIPKYDTG